MNQPKISVLIPVYNRKHYIKQCLDSVLNQTFRDFEIVVRDDGSTDGSADFVAEKYSDEISSGKIILKRNPQNMGELPTSVKLILDSVGKYFAFLHSDDMYLPHALQFLYETAEKFQADVVHNTTFLKSPPGGVIEQGTSLQIVRPERINVKEAQVMPEDQMFRFSEFVNSSAYFGDIQHSFFRREFVFDNRILIETRCDPLWWLLYAKTYVKTSEIYYVYRDAPDAKSNNNSASNSSLYPVERIEESIADLIERGRTFDKLAANFELFKVHPEFGDLIKARQFNVHTLHLIKGRNYYRGGIVSEDVRQAVERAFKKHFGDNASYPIFLFHMVNLLPHIPNFERVFLPPPQKH